ncbi:MAG TPA: NAD-dependent epimerase/dehydratase family protein [Kofleriaceae bacterium]|jgi:nucleoside-diphosphate-sugar epimerase|nr:NAD-dependent epimerase/dehydratase family protein [Kofleriaceae bacterium]
MRVLVIGGSGFIGTHVVAQLAARGVEVGVLVRSRPPAGAAHHIAGDRKQLAEHRGAIAAFAPDVVIDMILSSGEQAAALVEAVRGIAGRTVAITSLDVYRACGVLHRLEPGPLEPMPLTERSPLRSAPQTYPPQQLAALQHLFGWADDAYDKLAVERAVRALDATVLRLPLVYGPGDPLRRLQPVVRRILDGRRAILFAESGAAWRASRGYVEDVARAIALAAITDATAGRTYNVSEPDAPSELDWARMVAAELAWEGDFVVLPDEQTPPHLRHPGNFAQHWVSDSGRIRDELGYAEAFDRGHALAATIAWERETPGMLAPQAFDYAAEDAVLASQ